MTARHPLGLNDITVIAPPCMTPDRAQEIYDPAFRRVMEYVINSRIDGDILEFGTFHGYTARTLAELLRQFGSDKHLHLYDSWEGFPAMEGNDATCPEVINHKTWKQGDCTPIVPNAEKLIHHYLNNVIPGHVHVHKGFYENTIVQSAVQKEYGQRPETLPEKAALVHIDCDLYESAKLVLETLIKHDMLNQGTVILFDDWNNNFASNDFGERRAAKELFPYKDARGDDQGMYVNCNLERWFSYGSSGMAFIVHQE